MFCIWKKKLFISELLYKNVTGHLLSKTRFSAILGIWAITEVYFSFWNYIFLWKVVYQLDKWVTTILKKVGILQGGKPCQKYVTEILFGFKGLLTVVRVKEGNLEQPSIFIVQ